MPGSFLKLLMELWPEYKPRVPSTVFSLHCADSLQRWDNALRNIVNGCFDTSLHRIFSQLNISWQGSGSLECFVNLKSNTREVLFTGGSQCGRTRGLAGALCWESPLPILNGTTHRWIQQLSFTGPPIKVLIFSTFSHPFPAWACCVCRWCPEVPSCHRRVRRDLSFSFVRASCLLFERS